MRKLVWPLRSKVRATAGACLIAWGVVACSAADSDESGPGIGSEGDNGGIDVGDGDSTQPGIGAGGAASLPEEIEDEESYRAPVATGRYLWSANPESGRVALIDVVDLSVQVLSAGLFPTHLASVPSADDVAQALVLNVGSSDATRFSVEQGDDGEKVVQDKVATHVGANRWSVSKSGKWAVAWSHVERGQKLDPTEGLQEITVIDLKSKAMKSTRLTVGYRPSAVQIAADDKSAIVVSAEGITLVELGDDPTQEQWIDLGFEEELRDVSLNQEGTHALVRRTGLATVELFDLADSENPHEITFSGPVTDVDLAPNGRAVAVIRDNNELATFTLADVLVDPTDIDVVQLDGELFGSAALTPDGEIAVLYTNAVASDRVNIVKLAPGSEFLEHRGVSTQSSVFSVTTTPDGLHAAILGGDGTGKPSDSFSLLALRSERFPRVVGTGAEVAQVALSNQFGIVSASSKVSNVFEAYLVEFPSLSVRAVGLSTEPLSTGVIQLSSEGVSLAFAAQKHPEGRVTFFDFATDQARTLTGFELSAEVVDE